MVAGAVPTVNSYKVALLADLLCQAGEARVRVTGSSMLPAIWPADVITIRRRLVAEMRTGEIAVFTRDNRMFAHRVVAHTGAHVVTQGDTVPSPDAPVSDAELLGVVVAVVRRGRHANVAAEPGVASRLVAAAARCSSRANSMLQRARALTVQVLERSCR